MLSTQNMGGVTVSPADLKAMQAGDYVLHAREGKLEKVSVEKIRLPRDPQGHTQRLCMVQAPNGTIYAAQHTLLHKSTDGGKTWEHLERDADVCGGWNLQFDSEGTMLNLAQPVGHARPGVWASHDEGAAWEQIGCIDEPAAGNAILGWSATCLDDGALLVPMQISTAEHDENHKLLSGTSTCYIYRSEDGARNWSQLSTLGEWCHEASVAALPSGRLLAAIRYQRPSLPEDPPDLHERTGAPPGSFPYKHVFVAHSDDAGATWTPPRQLATVFGQCYGSGVGLSNSRAVIVTDHRYPRDMGSGRAVVSLDGGETWQDEVYYLVHGDAAGYATTICLDGEEMLTLTGSCYGDVDSGWDYCVGNTDFVIIRWRLV